MTKQAKTRAVTLALWLVCLIPTWAAIYTNPTTFWQTFSVGCLQIVLGLVAIAGTVILNDI